MYFKGCLYFRIRSAYFQLLITIWRVEHKHVHSNYLNLLPLKNPTFASSLTWLRDSFTTILLGNILRVIVLLMTSSNAHILISFGTDWDHISVTISPWIPDVSTMANGRNSRDLLSVKLLLFWSKSISLNFLDINVSQVVRNAPIQMVFETKHIWKSVGLLINFLFLFAWYINTMAYQLTYGVCLNMIKSVALASRRRLNALKKYPIIMV